MRLGELVYDGALLGTAGALMGIWRVAMHCWALITVLIVTILRASFPSRKKYISAERRRGSPLSGLKIENDDQKFQDHLVHCTHNIGYRDHIHCRLLCASHAGVH
jgi:hypothetical protein